MIGLEGRIRLERIDRAFKRASRRGKNLRPVFAATRKPLREDVALNFSHSEGPDGPWPARAAATIAKITGSRNERRVRGRRTRGRGFTKRGKLRARFRRRLQNPLGRLKTAYRIKVTRRSISAIGKARWSGVHQHGGRAGRGVRIPKRTHLWVTYPVVKDLAARMARYVKEAI